MKQQCTRKYNDYLDVLKESGAINMFASPLYLMKEFKLNQQQAKQVLINYLKDMED